MNIWESKAGAEVIELLTHYLQKENRKGRTYAMGMTNDPYEVAKVINAETTERKAEFLTAIPGPNNEKVTLVFRGTNRY